MKKNKIQFPSIATGEDAARYLDECWKNEGIHWRNQFAGNDFDKARRLLYGNSGLTFRGWEEVVAFLQNNYIKLEPKTSRKLPNNTSGKSVHTCRGGLCNGK